MNKLASDVTMTFKYAYTQLDRQQARTRTRNHTRRWRTLGQGSKVSCPILFSTISLPDRERRRCHSRPGESAVYAAESSVFSSFGDLIGVAR